MTGLDPGEGAISEPQPILIGSEPLGNGPLLPPGLEISDDGCGAYLADYCVEIPIRSAGVRAGNPDEVRSCSTGDDHEPAGSLEVVAAPASAPSSGSIRVRIEVEAGLQIDGECFADEVMSILRNPRGWQAIDDVVFEQTDGDRSDLRLILASPDRTDALCHPARTVGRFSCRKQDSVILNLMRWESGTDDYSDDLSSYRTYLVNHEVGHFLGRGHLRCPGPGELAPVMMQQTKGLGECEPNGWPTKDES